MIIVLLIVMFIILALGGYLIEKIEELESKIESERLYNNKVNEIDMDIFRKLHETNVIQFKKIDKLKTYLEKEIEVINVDRELKADAISEFEIDSEKILKALKLMNDMDITLLDKLNDFKSCGVERSIKRRLGNITKPIDGLEMKTKSCSIDGKCE